MAKLTPTERVERGVALLDALGPDDWRSRVNVEDLDMSSTTYCVLGQVYENEVSNPYRAYEDGLRALNIHFERGEALAARHGFDRYPSDDSWQGYANLDAAWKDALV